MSLVGDVGEILAPFRDSTVPVPRDPDWAGWTFVILPPPQPERGLASTRASRAHNRAQAARPAAWLVQQANPFGGLLTGNGIPARRWIRIDGIQVAQQVAAARAR